MNLAIRDDRIIISADTDFGALPAHTRATKPSVILVRALADRRPPELAGIVTADLDTIKRHLDRACCARPVRARVPAQTPPPPSVPAIISSTNLLLLGLACLALHQAGTGTATAAGTTRSYRSTRRR
jgi:hypothetical protein